MKKMELKSAVMLVAHVLLSLAAVGQSGFTLGKYVK